ncbi:MAG: hypothetical protein U0163_18850 [Gemmatimonadaceae bacterium]
MSAAACSPAIRISSRSARSGSSAAKRLLGELGDGVDHREHIVEIVGDPAGQTPHAFHLLCVLQLQLQLAAFVLVASFLNSARQRGRESLHPLLQDVVCRAGAQARDGLVRIDGP